jgi:hypothetical protein
VIRVLDGDGRSLGEHPTRKAPGEHEGSPMPEDNYSSTRAYRWACAIALALFPCAALLVSATSSTLLSWPEWALAILAAELILCWASAGVILLVGVVGVSIHRGSKRMGFMMAVGAALALIFITVISSMRLFARR